MHSLTLHNPCLTASLHPHKCPRSLTEPVHAAMIRKGSVALRLDGFPGALKTKSMESGAAALPVTLFVCCRDNAAV